MLKPRRDFNTKVSSNSLRLTRPSLQACVRCFLTRDIHADPADTSLRSVLPASPFPGITWTLRGHRVVIQKSGDPWNEVMPYRIKLYGINPYQMITRDTPDFSVFDVIFQPDAPHLLLNWDASTYHNQSVDALTALPVDWQFMVNEVFNANDHDTRQKIVEDFLEPRWLSVRQHNHHLLTSGTDWLQSALARVAISRPGSSIRQLERRFKKMVGIPHRQIKTLSRGERTLLVVRDLVMDGHEPNWAKLAVELDYYDQAQFCREIKRMTGHTPEELCSMARKQDDAFWVFQLWG